MFDCRCRRPGRDHRQELVRRFESGRLRARAGTRRRRLRAARFDPVSDSPEQLDWVRHEPTTTRKKAGQKPNLQYRTSPLNVLGGALLHWTGQSSRYMPGDFKLHSNEIESGNAERAKADLTGYDVIDWPLSYDDLEPYYEKFEWESASRAGGLNRSPDRASAASRCRRCAT
jgi:choline dehydrogenase-like flavoprotein